MLISDVPVYNATSTSFTKKIVTETVSYFVRQEEVEEGLHFPLVLLPYGTYHSQLRCPVRQASPSLSANDVY
jgi:hypothetical protein